MRRSTAPSLRQGPKFVSRSSETGPENYQKSSRATCSAAPFPNAIRSTASVLDLLSGSRAASPGDESPDDGCTGDMSAVSSISTPCAMSQEAKASSLQLLKDENVNRNQIVSQHYKGKRQFIVVWGKQSKKKHKTWEGDGILEVGEKTVILKDTDGKIIGQCSGIKTATLEEGSRLFVGSKEVEIIDVAASSDVHDVQSDNCGNKRFPDATINASAPVMKKPRKTFSHPVLPSVHNHKGPDKPLIMPPPTHEHQEQRERKFQKTQNFRQFSENCGFRKSMSVHNVSLSTVFRLALGLAQPPIHLIQRGKQQGFQADHHLLIPQSVAEWKYNPSHLPVVDVSVDNCIARVLRPHQRLGIVFMYECVLGIRKSEYYGAILADEMGLGKTLQCIAVVWMLLKQGPYGGLPVLRRILIVTPSSLVVNWQNEFLRWLGQERIQTFVVDQKNKPSDYKHLLRIPVMLISYEMFVRYYDDISQIHFDLIICDEGHRLKNTTIRTYALLYQLDCKRRILLTGTPIQNDLQEFYALVNFTNPGVLGSSTEFRKYFEEPVLASRQPSADEEVKSLGEQRALELNHCTGWFILRRTQEVIDKYLPTKHEMVVFCRSTPLQQAMYKAAVDYWESRGCESGPEEIAHLGVITALRKICNHPSLVRPRQSQQLPGEEDISNHLVQNYPVQNDVILPQQSGKLDVVMCLLQELNRTKQKVVLVSYFTQTLDLLANICDQKQYKYSRLDGSTPSTQRMQIVKKFNGQHSDHFVFLLSARAGGVGLNLTGASRLVLYDSDWNPATDLQAMSRIWRDGQMRYVYIYRLLTAGSIEEKIFQRQISKTGLSGAVVDPQNQSKIRLSNEELKDLFTFHCDSPCITHEMLNCQCAGVGLIPHEDLQLKKNQNTEYDEDELSSQRDCQLQVAQPAASSTCVRMNQLFRWQHYSQPIKATLLQELGLSAASHNVTFIFLNSTSQSQAMQL